MQSVDEIITISIIIPTYNEAGNIIRLLNDISNNIPSNLNTEVIVVDDNSPDGTAKIVEDYSKKVNKMYVRVLKRYSKQGLASAILDGIRMAKGEKIVVMDADLSHPPSLIPSIIKELDNNDMVIASRYINGSSIKGWPLSRLLMSKIATSLARFILRLDYVKDPLSGFFGFKRYVFKDLVFDALGYKLLLELIVRNRSIKIKELAYVFVNRKVGKSKLDINVMVDYLRTLWRLYRYSRKNINEERTSLIFLSKTARFYTVGLSGLLVNYSISYFLSSLLSKYQANAFGIISSITTNFILNKVWTFEDREFKLKRILRQYLSYLAIGSLGVVVQISSLNVLERLGYNYNIALLLSIGLASIGNFLLNKKFTFKEKVWS